MPLFFSSNKLFQENQEGFLLQIKVTPKASHERCGKIVQDANGKYVLKAFVTAVPENGKANIALIELLAKTFKLKKSQFRILRGETDRNKTISIVPEQGSSKEVLYQILAQYQNMV